MLVYYTVPAGASPLARIVDDSCRYQPNHRGGAIDAGETLAEKPRSMRFQEPLRVLGAGANFVALEVPGRSRVLKLHRPDGPLRKKGWKNALLPGRSRARSQKKLEASDRILQALLVCPSLDAEDFFPETRLEEQVEISFEWQGRVQEYCGWVYLQERVEVFSNATEVGGLDWSEIVAVQKALWSLGVGLGKSAETWGPSNWCLTAAGRIRLADTSSLTRGRNQVSKQLEAKTRENRLRVVADAQQPGSRSEIGRYFDFIGENLNHASLEACWKSSRD